MSGGGSIAGMAAPYLPRTAPHSARILINFDGAPESATPCHAGSPSAYLGTGTLALTRKVIYEGNLGIRTLDVARKIIPGWKLGPEPSIPPEKSSTDGKLGHGLRRCPPIVPLPGESLILAAAVATVRG